MDESASVTDHLLRVLIVDGDGRVRRGLRALLEAQPYIVVIGEAATAAQAAQCSAALRPSTKRKIVLATNIAETSLTIDGVTQVIDTGLARVAGYDPQRGLDRLDLTRISKASADQRAGRAGRTAPGKCLRLWSMREHHELADYQLPEIKRVDLAGTLLTLHAWGKTDLIKQLKSSPHR